MALLTVQGVAMPCPVAIKCNDEIIWSSGTGRSSSGLMVGDVVAQKQTYEIEWEFITAADLKKLKQYMKPGFYEIKINLGEVITLRSYRSTLTAQFVGKLSDGITYYKSASVSLIEQ